MTWQAMPSLFWSSVVSEGYRLAADDPLGHAADFHAGANSILTGIAANLSIRTGRPVNVDERIHW